MSFENYPVELERHRASGDRDCVPCQQPTNANHDHLTLKEQPTRPARSGSPLAGRDGDADARRDPRAAGLPRQAAAAAWTTSSTSKARRSDELEIRGDADKVKWIGRGMTRGRITIDGNAGMHLGAYMKGGTIEVSGNASDWLGAEMTGGLIRIRGNAGGQVGAAYRGSLAGMTRRHDPRRRHGRPRSRHADEARASSRSAGRCRDFAGLQMKGGTIVLRSGAEIRTGAWMIRGHDHLA